MKSFILFPILELVWGTHLCLDGEFSLRWHGVGIDGHGFRLEPEVAFTVIGDFYIATFARVNGLARIVRGRTTATLVDTRDEQRGIASVGKVEGI